MCHVLIDNLDLLERLCFDRRSETHPYHVRHSIDQLYSLLSLLHWEQSGQVWKADKQKGNLGEGEGRTGMGLLDSYEVFVQSGSKKKDLKDFHSVEFMPLHIQNNQENLPVIELQPNFTVEYLDLQVLKKLEE